MLQTDQEDLDHLQVHHVLEHQEDQAILHTDRSNSGKVSGRMELLGSGTQVFRITFLLKNFVLSGIKFLFT